MNKNKKIPLIIALLCIGQYMNQGISSLPGQCLYYLLRENWGLSASTLGFVGLIVGIAWYIKILWGYIADKIQNTKKCLTISYSFMLVLYGLIIIFGLNLITLIISGLLINICIAFADVNVDKKMVIAEQKYNLRGRLQSIQWIALGVGGLIVALLGAIIAKHIPEPLNYKMAYGLAGILPIIMLIYLSKYYKKEKSKRNKINFKENLKKINNPKLLIGLAFIICLNFCPSFGIALMVKMRETLCVDKMFLGYLGAMGTVLGIIGYVIYYKWAHRFPMKKLLYFMVVFSAITNLFYLYIPNQWFLVFYNLAFGAFGGITFMSLLSFFLAIIPCGSEAFFYALVTSISNFSSRGGNFLGGIIYDHMGYNVTVIISSITTFLCILFIPYLKIDEKTS